MEKDNLNNGVKLPENAPAGDGIKNDVPNNGTQPVVVPPTPSAGEEKPDFENLFYNLLDENARIASDRDNYRAALLEKKGKSETLSEDNPLQGVNEKVEKLTKLVETVVKTNKELSVALSNRSQVPSSPAGASAEKKTPEKDGFWSEEQMRFFKQRGLDPNKVKDNYIKSKGNS